ncbi:MAG TPA: LuxR C-terminal-related transcriptional regulator [Thermoleophilaceae bacterium]|nr:LuxR C-terminal-related transcriptional regulator [Thermoleophilaceae bacterium]
MFATKLVVPQPPPVTVRRPRLLDALDGAATHPFTLVSAPAGSGKTALVASWLSEGRAPGTVAWLSLGKEDDDRRGFWTAVVTALKPALAIARGPAAPPRVRIDLLLPALVEALAEPGDPVVLVLDDFHEVEQLAVMDDLQTLLDYAPSRLRLVVLTRSDPPLRLQRLRVAGRMCEIRAQDLAFTLEETRELIAALDLAVADDDLDTLCKSTAGWAAGLRLAALSLEGDPDPHAFIDGFAGTDHAVSDYLMSEVISRQAPAARTFLLRTSVPDRFTADLVKALTQQSDGDDLLSALMHRDGLITPLDGAGGWYSYHPMFLEVLRLELARAMPDEVAPLHRRAALWFRTQDSPHEAIRHAVAAHDWDLSAEIIGEHWVHLVIRGEGPMLRDALAAIPEDVTRASPELALALAGIQLDAGVMDVGELIDGAIAAADPLPEARRRHFDIAATSTQLYRARFGRELEDALRAARTVLSGHWDRAVSQDVRALTLGSLGVAEFWTGDASSALQHLQEAAGLARDCENDYLLFGAQGWGSLAALRTDQLEEARVRAFGALDIAELRGWTKTAAAAAACVTLGSLALLANDPATAAQFAGRAKAALSVPEEPLLALSLALLEAELVATRNPLVALDMVRAARGAAGDLLPTFLRVVAALVEADLLMTLGESAQARKLLVDLDAHEDASDPAVGLARIELASGAPEAAIRAVADFLADERDAMGPTARVDAWALDAIARDELRDEDGALRALERALDLAEPRGLVWPLTRNGAPVRSLVRRHIRRGTSHRALAGDVLAHLDGNGASERQSNGPLLEPLTEREIAVLRFLPTMMSNTEIASEMFVSVNTVKTHLKHVYRKLDVADRRDAVRRGRELRLLNPGITEH